MNTSIATEFGQILRKLRKEAGLTQEKLGMEAGLQRNYVSSLELGEKQPSLSSVFKLAQALKIEASSLIRLVEMNIKNSPKNDL